MKLFASCKENGTRRVVTQTAFTDEHGLKQRPTKSICIGALISVAQRRGLSFTLLTTLILGITIISGCSNVGTQNTTATSNPQSNQVVMYCSVDEVYARPIIRVLEAKTGLRIKPLFDVEASKTAGLASRIRAEKNVPRADIFWSSAALQTLLLSQEGLLVKHSGPQSKTLSSFWIDNDWSATGMRARVIVYHASVKQPPRVLDDLLAPRFKNKIGISNPLFGTGSDWVAALSTRRGHEKTLDYFRQLKANGAKVLPGNSVVAERVGRGELLAGVTDTDDFLALQKQFPALRIVTASTRDMVFIPMTAAIIKGSQNQENARKLLNALTLPEMEVLIVQEFPGVLAGHGNVDKDLEKIPSQLRPLIPHFMEQRSKTAIDTDKWAAAWRKIRDPLADVLLRD
jgi:iron(III) transport system substrate-binding protein